MGEREDRLVEKGYPIDDAPAAAGLYTPVVVQGNTAYVSGAVPVRDGALTSRGKVPSEVPVDDAARAAELCAANLLRVVARDCGGLDQIQRIVKLTGFVNADPGFGEPHVVVNGASALLLHVLGEAGHHARSAVGVASLPLGAAVEVELILEVK